MAFDLFQTWRVIVPQNKSASHCRLLAARFLLCATPILLSGCPANTTQEQPPVKRLLNERSTVNDLESRHGINIPDSAGWTKLETTPESTVWAGQSGNTYTLTSHRGKPEAPVDEVNELRDYVRKKAAAEQGGIIEAEIIQVDGHNAAYFITKDTIPDSMGYRYVGRCVISFDGGWHELRMDATAVGATGKREAILGVQLNLYSNAEMEDIPPEALPTPGSRKGRSNGKRIKGLFKDPYDSKFDSGSNYWVTDDAKFDSQFPQHELSRVRMKFPKIIDSITIP